MIEIVSEFYDHDQLVEIADDRIDSNSLESGPIKVFAIQLGQALPRTIGFSFPESPN